MARIAIAMEVDDEGAYTILALKENLPPYPVYVFREKGGVLWCTYEVDVPREAARPSVRKHSTEGEALLDAIRAARSLLDKEIIPKIRPETG